MTEGYFPARSTAATIRYCRQNPCYWLLFHCQPSSWNLSLLQPLCHLVPDSLACGMECGACKHGPYFWKDKCKNWTPSAQLWWPEDVSTNHKRRKFHVGLWMSEYPFKSHMQVSTTVWFSCDMFRSVKLKELKIMGDFIYSWFNYLLHLPTFFFFFCCCCCCLFCFVFCFWSPPHSLLMHTICNSRFLPHTCFVWGT